MEYKIIATYLEDLEERINELAQQGYEIKTHTSCYVAKDHNIVHTVIMERY